MFIYSIEEMGRNLITDVSHSFSSYLGSENYFYGFDTIRFGEGISRTDILVYGRWL